MAKSNRSLESFNSGKPVTPAGSRATDGSAFAAAIDDAHRPPDGPWDSMGRINKNFKFPDMKMRSLNQPPSGMRRMAFVPNDLKRMKSAASDLWGMRPDPSPETRVRGERHFGEAIPEAPVTVPVHNAFAEASDALARLRARELVLPDPVMEKLHGQVVEPKLVLEAPNGEKAKKRRPRRAKRQSKKSQKS